MLNQPSHLIYILDDKPYTFMYSIFSQDVYSPLII